MKVTYDPDVDVLRILLSNARIVESDEDMPGIIIDYGHDGQVVGIEILDASTRVENPMTMEYAIAEKSPSRRPLSVACEKRETYGRTKKKQRRTLPS